MCMYTTLNINKCGKISQSCGADTTYVYVHNYNYDLSPSVQFPSIRATDLDEGGAGPLEYTLMSGFPFSLSADGSTLRSTLPIDREARSSYPAVIRVQDSGGLSATSNLMIEVIDINDNAPRFLRTVAELNINIPENLDIFPHMDSSIRRAEAVDDDEGENARITYRLSGGRGDFDITQTTGVVRLIEELDIIAIPRYTLNVTATDGLHTTWRAFTVIVDNINDNNPEFLQPVFEGTLAENLPIGSTLLQLDTGSQIPSFLKLEAEDLDPASNVSFLLSANEPQTDLPFSITPTGYIVTTAELDREMQERYTFSVQATDGFRLTLTDAMVEVTVGDVNDESPEFEMPSYTVDVYELTPENAIFLILQANDADAGTNSEITYRIVSDQGGNTVQFGIGETSGGLFPTELVDIGGSIETTIILVVEAADMGTPSIQTTRVDLELNLVDRNLAAPTFTMILYEFNPSEGVDNIPVGTVVAMDSTGDQDSDITYRVVELDNAHPIFAIDNSTVS